MTAFTTRRDLWNWVDAHMGEKVTDEIVEAVTDWIQRDPNRPEWGRDWSEYLKSLDLWYIATGLGL